MERVKDVTYPIVTFVVIVSLWSLSIGWFNVPNYLLPTPAAVGRAVYRGYVEGIFWPHFWFTMQSTALGYAIGCGLALVLGSLLAESRTFERLFYPYILALQSMPKVALAPLLIVWFGFGLESKVVMVALVSFFPLFINTATGIRQTNPAVLDLLRAFSASRWMVFYKAKLPAAAGHIFAGLQISIVLSLIGAVVSEFVSSTRGLGHLIKASAVNSDVDVMFAALLSLAVIGILASQAVRLLHRSVVFWDRETANTTVVTV